MRVAILLILLIWWSAKPLEVAAAGVGRSATLRFAMESDARAIDPARALSNGDAMLAFLSFETLYDPSPEGGLIPSLAERLPETSSDGLTHTIWLRRGVRFSTGTEMTADDVVSTIERILDPRTAAATAAYFTGIRGASEFVEARNRENANPTNSAAGGRRRWIEPVSLPGIRARDRYTVEIQLQVPDQSFLLVLASVSAGIIQQSASVTDGSGSGVALAGTGVYQLQEWIRGARIRFGRNPHRPESLPARPGSVEVLLNVDRSLQAMMFERGELDFQYSIADPDFLRFRRHPELASLLRIARGSTPIFIALNCEMPPFTNRLVRRALNHAVDRKALVRMLGQRGTVGHGPLPLVVHGFNRDLPEYSFDPSRSRALLAEAGLPNGFRSTLWCDRDDPKLLRVVHAVQQQFQAAGVWVDIREVSYPALLESTGMRRTVPMCFWNWLTIFDDPKETLDSLLNGEKISDSGSMNNAFYSNPLVQKLFQAADLERDAARRMDIFRQIERQVVEDAPWVFLLQLDTELLAQPWLKGLEPRGFWPPARLEKCWIEN